MTQALATWANTWIKITDLASPPLERVNHKLDLGTTFELTQVA
jgi:hypothetical protein